MRNPRAGQFASRNPRSILLAGALAYRANAPDGVEIGVFAFADPATGLVDNARQSSSEILGLVLPLSNFRTIPKLWGVVPPGYQVTLATAGDFFVIFPDGASAGNRVYANPLDGTPVSGNTAGTEITPWWVMRDAAPGELCPISSWSPFS